MDASYERGQDRPSTSLTQSRDTTRQLRCPRSSTLGETRLNSYNRPRPCLRDSRTENPPRRPAPLCPHRAFDFESCWIPSSTARTAPRCAVCYYPLPRYASRNCGTHDPAGASACEERGFLGAPVTGGPVDRDSGCLSLPLRALALRLSRPCYPLTLGISARPPAG